MKRLALCAAFLTVVSGPAGLVVAQETETATEAIPQRLANGTQFGRWTLTCEAVAVGETACVLNQRIVRNEGGTFLADFLAFPNPQNPDEVFFAARVPMGAYLPAGFAIRGEDAGEDTQRPLTWQACSGQLCEALTRFSPDELAALEDGGSVIAGYRPSVGAEPVVFRFSMDGIVEGLDALGERGPSVAP